MDEIKRVLAKLAGEMTIIKGKVDKLDNIGEDQKQMLQEVQELRRENSEIRTKNEKLKERVERLEKVIHALENKDRKKNVVIRNLPVEEKNSAKQMVRVMLQAKMQVPVEPEEVNVVQTINGGILVVQLKKNEKMQVMLIMI